MIVSLLNGIKKYPFALEELDLLEGMLKEPIYKCIDREDAYNVLPEAEIIVTLGSGDFVIPLDEGLLERCVNLKLLFSFNAGVEKLPLETLSSMGVTVCNTRGAHATTIAEYVIGGMLVLSHGLNNYVRNQTNALWKPEVPGENIEDKIMCIIGAGSIGSMIGRKAKKLDMHVIGIKRNPCPIEGFDEVWGLDRLNEAIETSDYIVSVTPLTDETYHMIGHKEFKKMKNKTVFINVGRGDTVDEDALIEALKNHRIAGAVLDVFHKEPLPQESDLWKLNNVIITPHIAGPSKNTQKNAVKIVYDQLMRFRNGIEITDKII